MAVQLEPMKPTLKAPGSKRLKLTHEKLLSYIAFKFNLRRYTLLSIQQLYRISTMYWDDKYGTETVSQEVLAGAYTRPLLILTLSRLWSQSPQQASTSRLNLRCFCP